jgi:hypothetical protein
MNADSAILEPGTCPRCGRLHVAAGQARDAAAAGGRRLVVAGTLILHFGDTLPAGVTIRHAAGPGHPAWAFDSG